MDLEAVRHFGTLDHEQITRVVTKLIPGRSQNEH